MRSKKIRKTRKVGEPFFSPLDPARVIRALEGTMTEKQFIKVYDKAAGPRGGGLKTPPKSLQTAYAKFQESGDFKAFARGLGRCDSSAMAGLGRMLIWENAHN